MSNEKKSKLKETIDFTNNETTILETGVPADYSFHKLKSFSSASLSLSGARSNRVGNLPSRSSSMQKKYLTKALWLNNNKLVRMRNLDKLVEVILEYPDELAWLDLSYNYITHIEEVLLNYKHLKVLYLHGNRIADLNEVIILAELKELRKVTLQGNPMTRIPDYRSTVISLLPQLVNLDFSPITKSERLMPLPKASIAILSSKFEKQHSNISIGATIQTSKINVGSKRDATEVGSNSKLNTGSNIDVNEELSRYNSKGKIQ